MKNINCCRHLAVACGLFAFMILSAGCILFDESYKDVAYYDLGSPSVKGPENIDLTVKIVRNDVSAKYKMVYRDTGNQLIIDEYNKWARAPAVMVTSYMNAVFSTDRSADSKDLKLIFSGKITAFEIDLSDRTVVFGMDYSITRESDGKLLLEKKSVFRKGFKKPSADLFAMAMSESVADFITELNGQLLKLKALPELKNSKD